MYKIQTKSMLLIIARVFWAIFMGMIALFAGSSTKKKIVYYLDSNPQIIFNRNQKDKIEYTRLITNFTKSGSREDYEDLTYYVFNYNFENRNKRVFFYRDFTYYTYDFVSNMLYGECLIYNIIAKNKGHKSSFYPTSLYDFIEDCEKDGVPKRQYQSLDSLRHFFNQ